MVSLNPSPTTLHHFLWMTYLSPSPIVNLQMASLSPFPTSQHKYHLMRVQISRHSSVQSSSTFRSRKADEPIYIFRFKKIEQGKLLYPKIFPPIFLNTWQVRSPNCSSKFKSSPDILSHRAVYLKLGFHVASRYLSPRDPKILTIVLICSQDRPCQVSSIAEEICSVNCSKA